MVSQGKKVLPQQVVNACERSLLSARLEQAAAALLGCLWGHGSSEQTFPNLEKTRKIIHITKKKLQVYHIKPLITICFNTDHKEN